METTVRGERECATVSCPRVLSRQKGGVLPSFVSNHELLGQTTIVHVFCFSKEQQLGTGSR